MPVLDENFISLDFLVKLGGFLPDFYDSLPLFHLLDYLRNAAAISGSSQSDPSVLKYSLTQRCRNVPMSRLRMSGASSARRFKKNLVGKFVLDELYGQIICYLIWGIWDYCRKVNIVRIRSQAYLIDDHEFMNVLGEIFHSDHSSQDFPDRSLLLRLPSFSMDELDTILSKLANPRPADEDALPSGKDDRIVID